MQKISQDVYTLKYQLKDKDGNPIDRNIEDTFARVANALALKEKDPKFWEKEFLWAMENGALPGGRIIANAGAEKNKSRVSTINCTVAGRIEDSMDGILKSVYEGGITLSTGAGIGYCFSTLRPKGAFVSGAGAFTSGPLSFMDIFDSMCATISSAGGRRGAQMATFDISHPDIVEFIKSKRENGRFKHFNLSVLVTDKFLACLKNNGMWSLQFNGVKYKEIAARELWDLIIRSTYDYAEPGVIFIDRVNQENNLYWCEDITASNPCGEQYLPPYGACLLGSINLTKFIKKPFTPDASFDYENYQKVIRIFTRMLDNVVDINGLPLEKQHREIETKRRHGMGYLGLGSAITMLGMKYGESESIKFTHTVSMTLACEGWSTGVELAKEKGCAPIFTDKDSRELFIRSQYIQRIDNHLQNNVLKDIKKYGCRFTHHTSIAPTGTLSVALANNASNGIEPSFAHEYNRNLTVAQKNTREKIKVYSYESLLYRQLYGVDVPLPDYFITANDISPIKHIDVQAAAQYWIDAAISKTINVPSDYPFSDFQNLYSYAYNMGLKGCTTFRFNPQANTGILVNESDLAKTKYRFTLENGEVVELPGNESVEYDGQVHNVANLFDALNNGTYGKF